MADRELIIVGGGPAGSSAAVYAARSRIDTLMITEDFGGQLLLTDSVENYLGFPQETGNSISQKYEEHVKDYDVDIQRKHVDTVEKKDGVFHVTKEDGETVTAEAVIVACGTTARTLDVPGEEEYTNKGIGYCAVCDGPLYQDETVAVIGGGYAGTEAAVFLSDIAEQVYLVNYGDELSGEPITIEQIPDLDNVEVIHNADTQRFYGSDDGMKQLEGLTYEDRQTGEEHGLDVAAAFIEIGRTPNSDLVADATKDDEGKILTDNHCRTSVKGLYAAGDIADIEAEQAIVAAGDGCKAALDVATFLKDKEAIDFDPDGGRDA
ncbi:MAG: FAD-dependent oxidoreductase [Candidatus Nanohaloarchaea archaeon]|nr:FAD-dependent oxidoreductase [Candidatus Nanohaloarchaea archaeon]